MIISSSQVSLGHAQSDSTKLTQRTRTDISHADTTSNEGRLVMVASSKNTYDYSQYNRTKINAQSEIRQGDDSQQYTLSQVTEKLSQASLSADNAQIALQKAFPSGPATEMSLSGEVAFNFTHQIHYQQESNSFLSSHGTVTLADGREVDFALTLSQQQSTQVDAQTQVEFGLTKLKDPLVINFGSDTVQLQDTSFAFDMQANGKTGKYASLGKGSGYLTFDANGDGKVTDGSELFGTKTGNAYGELAQYDDDHNGWIDENDAIFKRLKLWQNQADPNATLTLTEAGVGAIYLGNANYAQELRGSQGELLGKTKQAGVVLMENGQVKTSQAIDLAELPKDRALKTIENSRAFKQLQKMADDFNHMQQARQSMKNSFKLSNSFNAHFGWSISRRTEETEKPKTLFEQLQEYIEKEIEARKKLLDWLESSYNIKGHA
ncbi:hypothetical protein [Hydrogenovibrio kuenenii]|uniref:hypothetical protein n=1 Tax=Hydrogenovibrio kuenenii TaxID=63658 RepID=UPI0012FF5751|nr:hypothetical protein [Hydrogenovibrio kuenenii]